MSSFVKEEEHTFILTPMKDSHGRVITPFKMERAVLQLGYNATPNHRQARIVNRSGEHLHLDMDGLLSLTNLLMDMLAQGKLT